MSNSSDKKMLIRPELLGGIAFVVFWIIGILVSAALRIATDPSFDLMAALRGFRYDSTGLILNYCMGMAAFFLVAYFFIRKSNEKN